MIVLVPWKPVVVIWILLSAILWCGYVGFSLMEGKNPFAPYTLQASHDQHSSRSVHHQSSAARELPRKGVITRGNRLKVSFDSGMQQHVQDIPGESADRGSCAGE